MGELLVLFFILYSQAWGTNCPFCPFRYGGVIYITDTTSQNMRLLEK